MILPKTDAKAVLHVWAMLWTVRGFLPSKVRIFLTARLVSIVTEGPRVGISLLFNILDGIASNRMER